MYLKKYAFFFLAGLLACSGKLGKVGSDGTEPAESNEEGPPGPPGPPGPGPGPHRIITENPPNWGGGTQDGVGIDGEGNLVLTQGGSSKSNYMWLADTSSDMVSKFDMKTGKEVARYYSFTNIQCKEGQFPGNKDCSFLETANKRFNPSRTAIDAYGNAWVANRGFSNGLSSVTKIAGDERLCISRKGGAQPNTSGDWDNSGAIEPGEVLPVGEDDCVLFTTPVCSGYNGARALAIDAKGDVWVGCYDEGAVYQIDSRNGQIKGAAIQLGIAPYGAIVDSKQNLWLTALTSSGALQGVNTQTREVLNKNAHGGAAAITPTIGNCYSYGLAVDRADRVWVSGGCSYNHYAAGNESKWNRCNVGGSFTGVVVDGDNNVYSSNGSTLNKNHWDEKTGACAPNPIWSISLGISSAKGVGFDIDGNIWTVGYKQAARITPEGAVTFKTEPAKNHSPNYYTYSDFTGFQHRTFTAPQGSYIQVIDGCPLNSWKTLSWDATVPEGTKLSVYVTIANTREALAHPETARHGPFENSPADLSGLPKSRLLQLEFVLESPSRQDSPILRGYQLEAVCERSIG